MPRGNKVCPNCNADNGPRSWNCKACGFGFTTKGVKHPDIDLQAVQSTMPKDKRDDASSTTSQRLWTLVERYDGVDDKLVREKYDMKGRTWQSKCGRYRIREQKTYMGVDMAAHFSHCIYLLKRSEGGWEVVRPKGRFKSPLAAIRRMVIDQEGRKPKATTRKEKTEVQVARRLNRKANYS